MFLKNNSTPSSAPTKSTTSKKEAIPSIITRDMNMLGNIISDGVVDFDGTLDGNIRCSTLTIRSNGMIKGEVSANTVLVYGKVKGLIRAKNVQLFSSCNVEGIIMHETIAIEDGAVIDGKFKRTDKVETEDASSSNEDAYAFEDALAGSDPKLLENLRLIR